MTEHKTQPEPSMDEILAGIRRIIVEDRGPAIKTDDTTLDIITQPDDVKWIGEPTDSKGLDGSTSVVDTPALLDSNITNTVISKLNRLEEYILQQKTQESKTIEQIVIDMLRPAIKNWLDSNLPSMVEHIVQCEIDRLIRVKTKL